MARREEDAFAALESKRHTGLLNLGFRLGVCHAMPPETSSQCGLVHANRTNPFRKIWCYTAPDLGGTLPVGGRDPRNLWNLASSM